MAIDIEPGQFCVVVSRYSERAVRADKVTAKQIRTHAYANRYDVTSREDVLFAGSEADAKQKVEALSKLRGAFRKDQYAAEAECRERCAPFVAARDAQIETFRANFAEARNALFAEQVSA